MVGELSLMEHIDKLSIDMGQSSPTGYKTTLSIWAMSPCEWVEYFEKATLPQCAVTRKAVRLTESALGFQPLGFIEETVKELSEKGNEIKLEVVNNYVNYESGEMNVSDMLDQGMLTESDGEILHDVSHIISLYTTALLETIELELIENA